MEHHYQQCQTLRSQTLLSRSKPVQVNHAAKAEVAGGLLRVLPLCLQPLPLHILLQRQLQGSESRVLLRPET